MKKKLSKILGVSLVLVLAFTLVGGFMPANEAQAQGVTPNQWNTVTIPSAIGNVLRTGSDVTDFSLGPDAGLDTGNIWAIDGVLNAVLRSYDGGNTFSVVALPAAFVGAPRFIDVAPDDPTVAVVVDSAGGPNDVWLTKTDGATWINLTGGGWITGTEAIYDIDVGPARSDAYVGRDIVVATADPLAWNNLLGVTTGGGNVYVTGSTALWRAVGFAQGAANFYDYTSVKFAPNWLGSRDVVAIASDNVTGTFLQVFRVPDDPAAAVVNVCGTGILINVTGATSPQEVSPVVPAATGTAQIVGSSLDLPADADFTSAGTSTAYVGWNSVVFAGDACDDVYRIDRATLLGSATVRKLGIGSNVGIQSISFSGTAGGGTCFASESNYWVIPAVVRGAMIWHAEDANVAMPSWMYSPKWPTGNVATTVEVSPDFQESKIVFAGTTGDAAGTGRSAFSRSTNGGVSYNQLSLVDAVTPIPNLNDVMPTPDNSVVFLSTNDINVGSLWRSNVPTTDASWERVLTRGPNAYLIRLSPDYLEDSTLYWCQNGGTDIRLSPNKGEVFLGRTAPANIIDFAVESKSVVYMADAGNVRKSTNTGTRFELPVGADAGALINSLAMVPTYPEKPVAGTLLVGGALNDVSISEDSAASFTRLLPYYPGATLMQVLGDRNFVDNRYVYAGSNTAGQGILRYKVGESAEWEQIRPIGATEAMTGLAMCDGVLYGSWIGAGAVAVIGADSFTITATAADAASTVTVLAGSLLATPAGAATVGGLPVLTPVTITSTMGAVALDFAVGVGDSILFEATTAATTGTWAQGAVTTTAAITTNSSGNAAVAANGGVFSLPDAATAAAAGAGSGVERNLWPFLPANLVTIVWDDMTVNSGADAFNTAPSALRAGCNDTAISVYAIDTITPRLKGYDDTMAVSRVTIDSKAKIPYDPNSNGSSQWTINWNKISNARYWEVAIYEDAKRIDFVTSAPAGGPPPATGYFPGDPTAPSWVVPAGTLTAGQVYYIHIRARDQVPGDAIRSQWAEPFKITIEAGVPIEVPYPSPQILGPLPGATGTSITPGFAWGGFHGATKYEFELSTDPGVTARGYFVDALVGLTGDNALVSTAWQCDITLDYATNYYWHVKAITATGETPWSTSVFTTMAAEEVPGPPVPPVELPAPITPAWIWAIVAIGAVLVIVVIVLIFVTRKP